MMSHEELLGTQACRVLQKEQERERRRLRDRQRRQSMTIEERERHLARRRRNYQLRRQRTEGKQLDYQHIQSSAMIKIESQTSGALLEGVISDDSCGVTVPSESYKTNKALGCEVAKFPRRLRVKQIRQLARLLHSPRIGMALDANQNKAVEQSIARNSKSRNKLRLIHIKRLARALTCTIRWTSEQTQVMTQMEPQQQQ